MSSDALDLAAVPATWRVVPLFFVADESEVPNEGLRETNLMSLSYGRIVTKDIQTNEGLLPASFDTYQVIEPGYTVLRLTDLQNDQRSLRTGYVKERGIITSAYVALKPRPGINPRFLAYLLFAYDVNKAFYALGGGLRQSMKFSDLRRLPVPLPPLEEQRRIADFLDDQTTRIDKAIQARRSQVELLDSLVDAYVFEGVVGASINDRQPTHLAWVDSLPVRWPVVKLGLVANMGTGHTPSRDQPEYWQEDQLTVPWVSTEDIRGNPRSSDPLTSTVLHISELGLRNSAAVLHPVGTVMLCRTASVGLSTLTAIESATSQRFVTWTPGPELSPKYLLYVVRAMLQEWLRLANGSTHGTVFFPDLQDVRIPLPDLGEQAAIARNIDLAVAGAEAGRPRLQRQLSLLRAYRQSMISAAVSGQFDVSTANGSRVVV
jgi:type I restriction enzyme S subunit